MTFSSRLHSPLIHVVLYGLMLVATPFLLLQNYLQSAIGMLSEYTYSIGSFSIPYTLSVAVVFAVILLFVFRHGITSWNMAVMVTVILMMSLGQYISDFYFNHNFWDLQHNWHYFAYGIYSFIMYRFYKSRNIRLERIVLFTFITAICVSTFDEGAQVYISSRIFDIGDISKDAWGTMMGLTILILIVEKHNYPLRQWKIRHPKFSGYFSNPLTLYTQEVIFVIILLIISSLLTDIEYLAVSILISTGVFLLVFLVIHFSQFRIPRIILCALAVIAAAGQITSFIIHRHDGISHNSYGFTVYNGIPLPFFDVMIFDNGGFRFVDKKHSFGKRDQRTIFTFEPDILLVGSGNLDNGGLGFPTKDVVQFVYNPLGGKIQQIIILPTHQACREFNRLKKEGKKVLFILHNTC